MIELIAAIGWCMAVVGWLCVKGRGEVITALLRERDRMSKQIDTDIREINEWQARRKKYVDEIVRDHDSRKGRLGVAAKQAQAWDRAHGVGLGAP